MDSKEQATFIKIPVFATDPKFLTVSYMHTLYYDHSLSHLLPYLPSILLTPFLFQTSPLPIPTFMPLYERMCGRGWGGELGVFSRGACIACVRDIYESTGNLAVYTMKYLSVPSINCQVLLRGHSQMRSFPHPWYHVGLSLVQGATITICPCLQRLCHKQQTRSHNISAHPQAFPQCSLAMRRVLRTPSLELWTQQSFIISMWSSWESLR